MYFSIEPMVTAPSPSFRVHAPSHSRSCGTDAAAHLRAASWSCATAPRPRTACPARRASASWECSCGPGTSTRRMDCRRPGSGPPAGRPPSALNGRRSREYPGPRPHRQLRRIGARNFEELQVLVGHGCTPLKPRGAGFRSASRSRPPSASPARTCRRSCGNPRGCPAAPGAAGFGDVLLDQARRCCRWACMASEWMRLMSISSWL